MQSIVIIGAGLIGQQWSMLFASNSFNVIVYEISESQIQNAKVQIKANLEKFINDKICRNSECPEITLSRIRFTSVLTELPNNVNFVMECVPDKLELKTKVFAMLDTYFNADTIRMSSSSFIPVSKFTGNLTNRDKCIIAHPVNPPYFLRLVELVPAVYTNQSTTDKVKKLMNDIGQVAIELKREVEGFAVNRIQSAVYNSIFNLLKNDIVSPIDVDKILTEGLAPRWTFFGPLVVTAMNGPGSDNYFDKYLSSIDKVNTDQGYPPQHDNDVISVIVRQMKEYDSERLVKINAVKDVCLGEILNIKKQHKSD